MFGLMFRRDHDEFVELLKTQIGDMGHEMTRRSSAYNAALDTIRGLVATNAKLTAELVILRGVGRVRTEQAQDKEALDPLLMPDIVVADETTGDPRHAQIEDIREELERNLAALAGEINTESISPVALEAAVITSPAEWQKEHAR